MITICYNIVKTNAMVKAHGKSLLVFSSKRFDVGIDWTYVHLVILVCLYSFRGLGPVYVYVINKGMCFPDFKTKLKN